MALSETTRGRFRWRGLLRISRMVGVRGARRLSPPEVVAPPSLTEARARRLAARGLNYLRSQPWNAGMLDTWAYRRNADYEAFWRRMTELGFPRQEDTEWTEAQKQADRLAEAEELGWLGCGRVALNKEWREMVERDDRNDPEAT